MKLTAKQSSKKRSRLTPSLLFRKAIKVKVIKGMPIHVYERWAQEPFPLILGSQPAGEKVKGTRLFVL